MPAILNPEDIIGRKFRKLLVLKYLGKKAKPKKIYRGGWHHFYLCKCDCGNKKIARRDVLSYEKYKGCGDCKPDYLRPSEAQKAYIAGFIDGEGCIHIRKYKQGNGNIRYEARLNACQQNPAPLKFIQKLYGGSVHSRNSAFHQKRGDKPISQYSIGQATSINIIKDIFPYLIVKKKHAKVALIFHRFLKEHSNNGSQSSARLLNNLEKFKLLMNSINKGGERYHESYQKI